MVRHTKNRRDKCEKQIESIEEGCVSDQKEEHPLFGQCSYSHAASQRQDCWYQCFIQSTVHASQCAASFAMHNVMKLNDESTIAFAFGA